MNTQRKLELLNEIGDLIRELDRLADEQIESKRPLAPEVAKQALDAVQGLRNLLDKIKSTNQTGEE